METIRKDKQGYRLIDILGSVFILVVFVALATKNKGLGRTDGMQGQFYQNFDKTKVVVGLVSRSKYRSCSVSYQMLPAY